MSTRLHGNEIALYRSGKRCAHGFMGGENCPECNPELMCCPLCGVCGHESKLCPATAAGRRRRAHLREQRKYQANKKRRAKARIGEVGRERIARAG